MTKSALGDVLVYICGTYPISQQDDLSNARLTKLVYLADWASARIHGEQLTDIKWILNHYGPWVPDVLETATTDPRLEIVRDSNQYGTSKRIVTTSVEYEELADSIDLPQPVRVLLDTVIADTQHMYFGQFVNYVYETTPVEHQNRMGTLDLVGWARREQQDHGSAEKLVNFRQADLDAVEYAALRDRVSQEAARQLLGKDILEAAIVSGLPDLNGDLRASTISDLSLAPEMPVNKDAPGTWRMKASGTVKVVGLLNRELTYKPGWAQTSQLEILDESWNEHEILACAHGVAQFEFEVQRKDRKNWKTALTRATVSPEVIKTGWVPA